MLNLLVRDPYNKRVIIHYMHLYMRLVASGGGGGFVRSNGYPNNNIFFLKLSEFLLLDILTNLRAILMYFM